MLTGASGRTVTLVADSTGGGMIETVVVDGYPLRTKGDAYALLVFDPTPLAALVGEEQSRRSGLGLPSGLGGAATGAAPRVEVPCMGQAGREPDLAGPGRSGWTVPGPGSDWRVLRPVLPDRPPAGRKPQLFDTMIRWRESRPSAGCLSGGDGHSI